MTTSHTQISSVLSLIALLASCGGSDEPYARAAKIERLDQAIGGEKALARPGDFLIENDRVRAVIVGERNSMGPGLFGGGLIDADLQRADSRFQGGNGNDQFAELLPTVNLNVMEPVEGGFSVVADGSDGGPATVRVVSEGTPYFTILAALWAFVGQPDVHLVTDYTVTPGEPWVKITTYALYGWDPEDPLPEPRDAGYVQSGEPMPVIEWAVENGLVMGDFYLQGGSIDAFVPNDGFHEDGLIFDVREAGRNLFFEPLEMPLLAGSGDGVSYGIAPVDGTGWVPLFSAGQTAFVGAGGEGDGSNGRFPDGTSLRYERYFFIGHGDIGSIVDSWVQARDVPHGQVEGFVLEEGTGQPVLDASVFAFEAGSDKPWNQWKVDVHPDDHTHDASFGGALPVGDWELMVHREGRPDSERIPVTVTENGTVGVSLEAPRPGLVSFEVRDLEGMRIPAKITLFRDNGEPSRDPDLGDSYIGGSPESVVFTLDGEGEVELPDGTYHAVASRGLEYELDVSASFTVDATRRHHLEFMLERSVQSPGWVSADLHVHAAPSHDSGVLLTDRVRTMAAEGVEFFSSTDHDYITDYQPVIESLGVERFVAAATGLETTTLEIGHYLAFPMQQDFLGDAGGATDWTGMVPEEIIESLQQEGRSAGFEPVVFIGHPRSGILGYFDQYGFDPYQGEVGEPLVKTPTLAITNPLLRAENISWEFDGLEILNGKRFDYLRTPTAPELEAYNADPEGSGLGIHDFVERTMEEQQALEDGTYTLAYGYHGALDDWFTLLNLGFRYTILGNSDTHSLTSTEAGCPRNYVMSDTDEPAFLDDQTMADAVRDHRVVASYGPFVQMWVNGGVIGSDVDGSGGVTLELEVQAPTWMDIDRVEIYENGRLIEEITVEPGGGVVRYAGALELEPEEDAWYVAVVSGSDDLGPVFTPVEIPYIELQEIVIEALSGVGAVSSLLSPAPAIPRSYDIRPFAVTNPIWVDVDGDGFQAPGIPDWLVKPEAPEEPEE